MAKPAAALKEGLLGDPAFAEEDARYPDWNKWLSIAQQNMLAKAIYATWALWLALYVFCKAKPAWEDKIGDYVSYIPLVFYLMAFGLVVGMVSKISISTKLSAIWIGLLFVFITVWPRLAVPAFGGLVGPFLLYLCLTVIWDDGVVGWKKYHLPGYMSIVAPGCASFNMLLFKGWCHGYLPKLVYWLFCAVLMTLGTVKELNKAKADKDTSGFDYKVNIPTFARLIPFRLAVLTVGLGIAMTYSQEQILGLLKDDVWVCNPKSW